MRKWIEPFIVAPIATERAEDEIIYYYDARGQLLAEVYHHDGQFCSGTFYDEGKRALITKEQAIDIAEHVKHVLQQEHLQFQDIQRDEDGYLVEFRRVEPVYGLIVQGCGLFVTISDTGFVANVTLHE